MTVQLRRSVFITLLSTNFTVLVSFGVIVALSHLLSPADVGIFSITVVFINVAAVLRDFGVASYLRQQKDLTQQQSRAALGLLITTGWSLALCLFIASEYLAGFYGQPGIGSALRVLTISFALIPFASYFHSQLGRNLQAGRQAAVNAIGLVAHAVTCLSLAYLEFGYMSLAWANVANQVFSLVAYWFLRPASVPLLPAFWGWRGMAKFGGSMMIGDMANEANNALPDLLLGKLAGPHEVGLYSRGNGLVGMFNQIIGPTVSYNALPYMAHSHHAGMPLAPVLSKSTTLLAAICWPGFAVLAVFSEEIIRVLFGAAWLEAAPVVAVICIQSAVKIGYLTSGAALVAVGYPSLYALKNVASLLARVVAVFASGADTLMEFAIAICVADILSIPVTHYLASRYVGYTLRMSLVAHGRSFLVGGACLALALLLSQAMPADWPAILRLCVVGLTEVALWLTCILCFRHLLVEELEIIAKNAVPERFAPRVGRFLRGRMPRST